MHRGPGHRRPLHEIAREYFAYLGSNLPQQCASDEFYFLPRAETAQRYLTTIDDLTPEKVNEHVQYVENLLADMPSLEQHDDIEDVIDAVLLKQSMKSFLIDFRDRKVWRHDPTLYVKIPLFATDQALSKGERSAEEVREDLCRVFGQIPSFLKVAMENLRSLSEIALQIAHAMAEDALRFYKQDLRPFVLDKVEANRELVAEHGKVLDAWERFKRDLTRIPVAKSFAIGDEGLKRILSDNLSYDKSPQEILEAARCVYEDTQRRFEALAREIDSSKGWKRIIYEDLLSVSTPEELMHLFQQEIQRLRSFFVSKGTITFPSAEKLVVLQTPSYLQSLRATASYRTPLTGNGEAHGIFYITPGREDLGLISAHCPYLAAHETYPGHHLLDHIRIHHPNPIRRQIESPLFYEGWACYAEQLLDELGYVQNKRQYLIQLKRQLWRILRAMLDVKLHTGGITLDEAAIEIEKLGFSRQRAERQVRRFALTPGYQSCYFVGSYEILQLRDRFLARLGVTGFHDRLLNGGEIPFKFVEKRLQEKADESG